MSGEQPAGRPVAAQLADLVLYAPIGAVLEARRILPEVVDRGRRQVRLAHAVGRLAVRQGRRRVDGVLDDVFDRFRSQTSPAQDVDPTSRPLDASPRSLEQLRSARALAIPEYDSLSASQVIPRLESLDTAELEAVRVYEAATRGRRTILGKVTQLQSV